MEKAIKTALAFITVGVVIKVVLEKHEQSKQLDAYVLSQLKRYAYPKEELLKAIIKRGNR
ncbi:TPA: hypothetical protein ACGO62_001091 [Streptococcus suis]